MNKTEKERLHVIRMRAFDLRKRVHEDTKILKALETKRGLTPDSSGMAREIQDVLVRNQVAAETTTAILLFLEGRTPDLTGPVPCTNPELAGLLTHMLGL